MQKDGVPWVFGLRPFYTPDERMGWGRTLINVLLGNLSGVRKSPSTIQAEAGLGILPSWYWYVGRSSTRFGHGIFLWDVRLDGLPSATPGVCSFDTGGLWHGYIKTAPPVSTADMKREVFQSHDRQLGSWWTAFDEYLRQNYDTPSEYLHGLPPRVGSPPIICDLPNESAAWTWEGRITLDLVEHVGPPSRFFVNEEDLDFLFGILETDQSLDLPERKQIAESLTNKDFTKWLRVGVRPTDALNAEMRSYYER